MCFSAQKLPNCDNYNEEKQKYETLFGDMKSVNYDDLPKLIIEKFDLKKFNRENLVIYYSNVIGVCGYPPPRCTPFYQIYPLNEEKIWTLENIILLQNKIKKNIIPKTTDNFISTENSFFKQFKTSNSSKGIMKLSKTLYYPNSDREFYYFPYNRKKLLLINNGHFYEEADTFQIIIKNINSKKIKVEHQFLNEDKKNYSHTFEYINLQWQLIETKQEN